MKVMQSLTNKTNDLQIPRLNTCSDDFEQSLRFATYILEKGLHRKKSELKKLILLAFETSMIVSYARPFTTSRDFNRRHISSPLEGCESLAQLTDDESKLHKRVITKRNTDCAHSDDSAHLVEDWDYSKTIIEMRMTLEPLTESETVSLIRMIKKWIDYLKNERALLIKEKRTRAKDSKSN